MNIVIMPMFCLLCATERVTLSYLVFTVCLVLVLTVFDIRSWFCRLRISLLTLVCFNKYIYSHTILVIFYRTAWNADAVLRWEFCLSVRLSVCQTRALWQNGRNIRLYFYIVRKTIYHSFLRRRMVGGGDPFYPRLWVNRLPFERNRRFWTNNRS